MKLLKITLIFFAVITIMPFCTTMAKSPVFNYHFDTFYNVFKMTSKLKGYNYICSDLHSANNQFFYFDVSDGNNPIVRISLFPTTQEQVEAVLIRFNSINDEQINILTNVMIITQSSLLLNDNEMLELDQKVTSNSEIDNNNGKKKLRGTASVWCKEANKFIYEYREYYKDNGTDQWSLTFYSD